MTTSRTIPGARAARAVLGALAAVLLVAAAGTAMAQNAIEGISVSRGSAGRTVLKFTFRGPVAAAPAGFSITNPPRIALDFADTANATGATTQEIGEAALRNLNVVQAGTRTRVVLNLSKPQGYETQVDGRTVLVTLVDQETVAAPAAGAVVSRFAESRPDEATVHSIRDVDFRRGRNGEGRIIVDLSDAAAGIDIRQQGKTLIVEFLRTTLPRNLERRLDVTDFATPVVQLETFAVGANTRMVVEPKGLWEHSAYQADNRFILEIKPVVEDPNKLTQGSRPGYKGEKLSLNFQNVEVRSVLQVIADFTGLNIITSDTVTGNLTLRLKDVPWDQALDIIMQTKGLDMRKNGNVVLIAPRDELATKEKLELEAKQAITDLEPLQTEMFQLNYQKAEAVQKIIADKTQAILSKRGSAVVDPRTNMLMVQDVPSRLDEVRRLINRIDVTVRQVMIEARIVIADNRFSQQLGVRFGSQSGHRVGGSNVGLSGRIGEVQQVNPDTVTFQSGSTPIAAGLPPYIQGTGGGLGTLNVNLPVIAAGAGSIAATILNLGSGNLIAIELSALEAANRGKVVSSPRVVTADNQKAVIEQGTEIPYVTPGSANSPATVSFKKAVLSLAVTPQITPDNRIIMTLEVKKDSVGQFVPVQGGGLVPSIDTKNVVTQIVVNNGETAVIGGIFEETVTKGVDKIPFLGDLPYLGVLFRRNTQDEQKVELLVFITPRIVQESVTAVR